MCADAFVISQPPELSFYDWLCDPSNPDRISNSAQELINLLRSLSRKRGFAWPRQSTIAEMMNKSVDRVKQLVREVKEVGLIIIKRSRQNFYRLVPGIFTKTKPATPSITPSITPSNTTSANTSEHNATTSTDHNVIDIAKDDGHDLDNTPHQEARGCSSSNARSKYTLAQCIMFAVSLMSSGITTPRAYGAAIWRDGREDDRIAEFVNARGRQTAVATCNNAAEPDFEQRRNHDPNCPHCFGLGLRYEDNNWRGGDILPCDCYIN